MRFLVWACRVLLVVVIGTFAATVFFMTHDVGTDMDSALPALNLITVIGAGLLGVAWALMRRYWQGLFLLIALGVLRGLFGRDPGLSSLRDPLTTRFQEDFLWFSIGAIGLALIVCLVARAIISDRAMRAMKHVTYVPAATVAPSAPSAPAELEKTVVRDSSADASKESSGKAGAKKEG